MKPYDGYGVLLSSFAAIAQHNSMGKGKPIQLHKRSADFEGVHLDVSNLSTNRREDNLNLKSLITNRGVDVLLTKGALEKLRKI